MLMTNRKLHMRFRMVPTAMTLDDLGWHYIQLFCTWFRSPPDEDRPILSAVEMYSHRTLYRFWQYKVYVDVCGGWLEKSRQMRLADRKLRYFLFSVISSEASATKCQNIIGLLYSHMYSLRLKNPCFTDILKSLKFGSRGMHSAGAFRFRTCETISWKVDYNENHENFPYMNWNSYHRFCQCDGQQDKPIEVLGWTHRRRRERRFCSKIMFEKLTKRPNFTWLIFARKNYQNARTFTTFSRKNAHILHDACQTNFPLNLGEGHVPPSPRPMVGWPSATILHFRLQVAELNVNTQNPLTTKIFLDKTKKNVLSWSYLNCAADLTRC